MRDQRNDLYRRERVSLDGPHEEAETQRKVLKPAKNLAFSEDTCLQKKRVRLKVTPRKVGVGLKRRRELNKRRSGWRLAWWGFAEKEVSHLLGLRGRHQYSDQNSNQNKAPSVASNAVGTERKKDQMDRSSAIKKAADGKRHRSREIIDVPNSHIDQTK